MNRIATPNDAPAVVAIYNHYIHTSTATFETDEVDVATMADRIAAVLENHPFIVREESGRIVGYAYATRWKERPAYRHTVESSVYVAPDSTGAGHGRALCVELVTRLRRGGVHAVVAGVSLPNPASVGLHESLGFSQVAEFRETGFKFNTWIDVGYWELILDPGSTRLKEES